MATLHLLPRPNSSAESRQTSNQSDTSYDLDSKHNHQVYSRSSRFTQVESENPFISRPRQCTRLLKLCADRLSLKFALLPLLIFSIITIAIHKYGKPLDWSRSDSLQYLHSFGSSSKFSFNNTRSKKMLTERKFLVRDWS